MNGLRYADCHEIFLTSECTAIITVYDPRSYDLTAYNITDGWLLDSYFQEIDLATGALKFNWRASDYVDIMDSVWSPDARKSGHVEYHAYDYFHINSVEKDARGNYLVSARHTNSIYYISGINGQVIWTLGGPKNKFRDLSDGRATDFSWQHHARWTNANMTRLSLFDDRNTAYYHSKRPVSRGMVVELDFVHHTAELIQEWDALHGVKSEREGSMQLLPNGNALIGYGEEPAMTEYSPDGKVLWDITFGPLGHNRRTADNYRIMKTNWTGAPTQPPKIAVGPPATYVFNKTRSLFHIQEYDAHGGLINRDHVYISWNGATEAVRWIVLASNKSQELSDADYWTSVPKKGFETSAPIDESRYLQALGVDARGKVIGASDVLDVVTGNTSSSRVGLSQFELDFGTRLVGEKSALGHLKNKWNRVKTQVEESGTKNQMLGMLGLIFGGILAGVLSWMLIRCHRRRSRGYSAAATDDSAPNGEFRDDSNETHENASKQLCEIDMRSLSSSHSQASSCLSEDLKKHSGGLLETTSRPGTSGG